MNFKTLLLSSTLILSSVLGIGINEAQARPTDVIDVTTSDGDLVTIVPTGPNSVHVLVTNDYTGNAFIGNMDCSTGGYEWKKNAGYTKTQMEDILIGACRF